MSKDDSRMWGGRFNEPTDAFVQAFTASVAFDRRLAHADIEGSLAHAKMLKHIGVLNSDELTAITYGLQQIRDEIDADRVMFAEHECKLTGASKPVDSIATHGHPIDCSVVLSCP